MIVNEMPQFEAYLMIVIYDCKTFIVQATDEIKGFLVVIRLIVRFGSRVLYYYAALVYHGQPHTTYSNICRKGYDTNKHSSLFLSHSACSRIQTIELRNRSHVFYH
jgi:hypothetical protein